MNLGISRLLMGLLPVCLLAACQPTESAREGEGSTRRDGGVQATKESGQASAEGNLGAATPSALLLESHDTDVVYDEAAAARFAQLALECIEREYPNKIAHVMQGDADVKPPHDLTPVFYGCFDWHSAVHGHWLLARLVQKFPETPFAAAGRQALARNLTPARIAGELAYLQGEGRATFERPYGLAWLLQLCAELREWDDPQAQQWATALEPLESEAAARLMSWLPKLRYPIRTGEHSQTAFALGLALDWARSVNADTLVSLVVDKILTFHRQDRDCPLSFEPSGQDFLSPCLAEADLMRRVLSPSQFATWLDGFLPGIPNAPIEDWLPVAEVTDRTDGKLAHLDGLNLSRAWMLEGIASGLPPGDPRISILRAAADSHRRAGLSAVTGKHYEGGHWLGSFAVYLVTERGLGR